MTVFSTALAGRDTSLELGVDEYTDSAARCRNPQLTLMSYIYCVTTDEVQRLDPRQCLSVLD